jgi:hypothetical protein
LPPHFFSASVPPLGPYEHWPDQQRMFMQVLIDQSVLLALMEN